MDHTENPTTPGSLHGAASPSRWWRTLRAWFTGNVLGLPLTPSLQPTKTRQKVMGVALVAGNPILWWMWAVWRPQPYENLALHLLDAALGLTFFTKAVLGDPSSTRAAAIINAVYWVALPFTFWFLYFANGGNAVWLASVSAMTLVYCWLTDWRLAAVGMITAALAAFGLSEAFPSSHAVIPDSLVEVNGAVVGLCGLLGIVLGMFAANLRHAQISTTLTTIRIMAHELRTPLATVTLIADSLRGAELTEERVRSTAERLHALVRTMNHQIDTQIANARLLTLPNTQELVRAGSVIRARVLEHPYRTASERDCVSLVIRDDFYFLGSTLQFGQTIDNLLRNALRAMAVRGALLQHGDVEIVVDCDGPIGRVRVADKGSGISPALLPNVFEPFFSTSRQTAHGLGLAFCKRAIEAAEGTIRVSSRMDHGATFLIELPTVSAPVPSGMAALTPIASTPAPLARR